MTTGNKQMTSPDPREIWGYAESFRASAEILAGSLKTSAETGTCSTKEMATWAPLATMDALASELYFKTLHLMETGSLFEGHDYKAMFNRLPSGTRTSLRYSYNEQLKKQNTRIMSARARSMIPFDICLKRSSQVFERVRYFYERKPVELFYWTVLREALRETILAIHPRWRPKK